jgi:DNA-binding transcriptional ArsR family regulator
MTGLQGPAYDRDVLAVLLGGTRAAVLLAAARGDSTSDLAERLDVSVASASQHLTALHNAGLVSRTHRKGLSTMTSSRLACSCCWPPDVSRMPKR